MFSQAEDKPLVSNGKISFYVDRTAFYGDSVKNYEEFSLMIYADKLKLVQKEGKQVSLLQIASKVTTMDGIVVLDKNWETEVSFDTARELNSMVVNDRWGMMLEPGEYRVYVTVQDKENKNSGYVDSKISIHRIAQQRINVSQIQFVNKLEEKETSRVEAHQNKIPNTARRFGIFNPVLQFYYEVYADQENVGKELIANFSIKDLAGKEVKSITGVDIKLNEATIGLSQAINISKLQSGVFCLEITLKDTSSTFSVSTKRNFEIIQADYFTKTLFIKKEDSEIIEHILGYIATPEQLDLYKRLNSSGKAYFIIQFFRNLDPIPETDKNEYLETLFERYHYSKLKFGWGKTEGWASERGRVFIQNGKPNEIEYHNFDANSKPYEVWYYRRDREIYFVFGDLQNDGRLVLIHSTKEGEVINQDWQDLLK